MAELPVYYIENGVRRAKAALECGREAITVQVDGDGIVFFVSLEQLRSPKKRISTSGVRGLSWDKILRATQNNVVLPPIEVTRIGFGIPLIDVVIDSEEETLDDFRRRYREQNPPLAPYLDPDTNASVPRSEPSEDGTDA